MATPATSNQSQPPKGFDVLAAKALAPQILTNLTVGKSPRRDYYDRNLMRRFQTASGIAVDGLYGGGSRGALLFYAGNASNPPQPFFKPTATQPYPWSNYIAGQLKVAPAPAASAPAKPAPKPVAKPKALPAVKPAAKAAPKPAAKLAAKPKPAQSEAATLATSKPGVGFGPSHARKMAKQVNDNLVSKGRNAYDRALLKKFQSYAGIAADGLYGGTSRGALIYYGIANPPQPFFKPTTTVSYPWAAYIQNLLAAQKLKQAAAVSKPVVTPSAPTTPVSGAGTAAQAQMQQNADSDPYATDTQPQVNEYDHPVPSGSADYGPSGPSGGSSVITPAGADSGTDAPAPAPEPASGMGVGILAFLAIGGLAFLGYKVTKDSRRKRMQSNPLGWMTC